MTSGLFWTCQKLNILEGIIRVQYNCPRSLVHVESLLGPCSAQFLQVPQRGLQLLSLCLLQDAIWPGSLLCSASCDQLPDAERLALAWQLCLRKQPSSPDGGKPGSLGVWRSMECPEGSQEGSAASPSLLLGASQTESCIWV